MRPSRILSLSPSASKRLSNSFSGTAIVGSLDMLSAEARSFLQEYERGNRSNPELAEWLVQVEYDTSLQSEERDTLAGLRLVVLEEAEGLRPEEEVLDAVAAILALEKDQTILTVRTSSSTKWEEQDRLTESGSPVLHAGISP